MRSKMRGLIKNIFYSQLARNIVTTTTWNTLGKGIGFLIPFFIAAWFGIGVETDIFFFIYGIIFYSANIFSNSLESNMVPFIAEIKKHHEDALPSFINKLLSFSVLITSGIIIALIVFGGQLLNLVTNFPTDQRYLLFRLLIEFCPFILIFILSSVLAGILNANFKFWVPAIAPGIRAIVCIGTIFLLKKRLGIHSVILGYLIGETARLFIFGYLLIRERIASFKFDFSLDPESVKFFRVISFQVICMFAIGLNPVVDKAMASWLGMGKVSILQYAERINDIPVAFIYSGMIVVILSSWSARYYEHKNITLLKNDLNKALIVLIPVVITAACIFFAFSRQIVDIAYARGKFPDEFIGAVRNVFLWYLIGMPFFLLGQVVVRAHLVLHNTKELMIVAFMANVLNLVLNLVLMRIIGAGGIALSTSIVSAAIFFYLLWKFNLKAGAEGAGLETVNPGQIG